MTINAETATVKPFMLGRSQAIRLPKNFRFDAAEVELRKEGEKLVVTPKADQWAPIRELFEEGGWDITMEEIRGGRPPMPLDIVDIEGEYGR